MRMVIGCILMTPLYGELPDMRVLYRRRQAEDFEDKRSLAMLASAERSAKRYVMPLLLCFYHCTIRNQFSENVSPSCLIGTNLPVG
ncbi:hypothetical protein PVAP13_7NG118817 [Panicum virgatum]|uniref:Uncharacterized protein n=1 Tax=Panicum virgatum TaxID=38727 RepID=A0A8T0PZ63_PANVG|nr:hypothetical protein PVAP13_7NG118817 [Panicum virgatum]